MTNEADRWTVEELITRYDLEPSLRDIFVEGPSDRVLVETALRHLAAEARTRVYEVDTVDVPAADVIARALQTGCKGRALTLADLLGGAGTRDLRGQVVCLVDSDLDRVLGRCRDYRLVVYTVGPSLDRVLASPAVLEKLLSIVCLGFPITTGELLAQMLPVLNECFLLRIAAAELQLLEPAPPLTKACSFDGRRLLFDREQHVKKLLLKAGAAQRREEFSAIVDRHRGEVEQAAASCLHAEDFLELLHLCVRRVKPRALPVPDQFRRFLFGFVEPGDVAELPELQETVSRLGVSRGPTA